MEEAHSLSSLRKALGLSTNQMAAALGLEGSNASDKVREIERGRPMSGPIQRIVAFLQEATPGSPSSTSASTMIPTWLDCQDLEPSGAAKDRIIMRTKWPRFYGLVCKDINDTLLTNLDMVGIPVVGLDHRLELGHLAVFFIDKPVKEVGDLIAEAVRLVEASARVQQRK